MITQNKQESCDDFKQETTKRLPFAKAFSPRLAVDMPGFAEKKTAPDAESSSHLSKDIVDKVLW